MAEAPELMIDLSRKTVLFWDASAGYSHIAEALVGDFAAVKYFSPWESAFPSSINALPGEGLDGIERVADFFDVLDTADLVVFTDVGMGGLQEWLRRSGMPVFGCGAAERLERDRYYLKSICKKAGIGCADAMPIKGFDNLREFLNDHEDLYVKLSYWRGDKETFHWVNELESGSHLDDLRIKMGPYKNLAEFIVETPIEEGECVEVGADPPASVDGMYPDNCLWGYEVKDSCYGGTTLGLPKRLQNTLTRLAPVLKSFNYRGPLSFETKELRGVEGRVGDAATYFLDITCRFPEPPSSLQRFMVRNLGEIFYEAANGRLVEPDYVAPIGVQIVLRSEFGAEHPLALSVGRMDRVAIHGHANIDGQDYAVSPAEIAECAGACGMGWTLEEAMEEALDAADSVKGRDIKYDKGDLEKLTEAIATGNKLGLNWSGSPQENSYARA